VSWLLRAGHILTDFELDQSQWSILIVAKKNLLKRDFVCESRGEIAVKGTGLMSTYFLLEESPKGSVGPITDINSSA